MKMAIIRYRSRKDRVVIVNLEISDGNWHILTLCVRVSGLLRSEFLWIDLKGRGEDRVSVRERSGIFILGSFVRSSPIESEIESSR